MVQKSLEAHIALCSTRLLRILNLLVIGGSISSIIIETRLERSPSILGWSLIIVGAVTCLSGFIGCLASNQKGCFSGHFILLCVSLLCLIAGSVVFFLKMGTIRQHLNLSRSKAHTNNLLLRIEAFLFVGVGGIQLVVFVLANLVHFCGYIDFRDGSRPKSVNIADVGPRTVVWSTTKTAAAPKPASLQRKQRPAKCPSRPADSNSKGVKKLDSEPKQAKETTSSTEEFSLSFEKGWKAAKDLERGDMEAEKGNQTSTDSSMSVPAKKITAAARKEFLVDSLQLRPEKIPHRIPIALGNLRRPGAERPDSDSSPEDSFSFGEVFSGVQDSRQKL